VLVMRTLPGGGGKKTTTVAGCDMVFVVRVK
jgi:hypothetical protein